MSGLGAVAPEHREETTKDFLWFVWELCLDYGGSITSGCRSTGRNADVGGSPKSKHTFSGGWGLACDIAFDTEADTERAKQYIARDRRYHLYHPDKYGPKRIHLQAFKVGYAPPSIEED